MASKQHDQFLQQLRETFKVEAREQLEAMSAGISELGAAPEPGAWAGILEKIFRAAHSLKGAARAVEHSDIESLCQLLENVFSAWRKLNAPPPAGALDVLHHTIDGIFAMITPAEQEEQRPQAQTAMLRRSLNQLLASPASTGGSPSFSPWATVAVPAPASASSRKTEAGNAPRQPDPAATSETVRVPVAKLEARLMQAEELLTVKLLTAQHISDLRELLDALRDLKQSWNVIEPNVRSMRQTQSSVIAGQEKREADLGRLLDFLDQGLEGIKLLEGKTESLVRKASRDRHAIGRVVDDVVEESKRFLLLPFATVSAYFSKVVRDLCRDQGKEADFIIQGDDIEIDKRILEELKDPLVHLLRNSVDHGIETPQERQRRGKPSRAQVFLVVRQISSNKVQLSLADDGAGIDAAKVKEAAVAQGMLSEQEAREMDEQSAQQLIFRSKVSTSPIITNVSGRGMGLAIVSEKAEKLDGKVEVESTLGTGTTFRIEIPTVRATFHGILTEAAGRNFIVPTSQVAHVAHVRPEEIRTVEGHETIMAEGRATSLVWLADVLELPPGAQRTGTKIAGHIIMLLGAEDNKVAFVVDSILAEHEILVRPLQKPLSRVRNIAGATVLGSGQVVPILNVTDLLKSARRHGRHPVHPTTPTEKNQEKASILVAEDSITSRMLLKGILESAGYRVKTAVDGLDAFASLREEKFDLLVSDVEMPRLNGFDLTARIRADRKLGELPVVLVTALEKREEREQGIEVGCNAYIVKRSFDQSNLLEAVKRLI